MTESDQAIVVAAYPDERSIGTAIECLEKSRFRSEEVSLVRRHSKANSTRPRSPTEPATKSIDAEQAAAAKPSATDTMSDSGAVGGGAAIGGVAGLMAASTLMGPLLVAGPLAGMLAGGVAGATAAAVAERSESSSLATKMDQMVGDGLQLVVVRSSISRVVDAEAILATTDPVWVERLG